MSRKYDNIVGTYFAWTFNVAFFRGDRFRCVLPIGTCLAPYSGETPLVRKPIPDAVRKTNLRPVAVVPDELTVEVGSEITIDGSRSHDPEGQPLVYRWEVRGRGARPRLSEEPIYRGTAGDQPDEFEIAFWVIDGLRASEPAFIKVRVEAPDTQGR